MEDPVEKIISAVELGRNRKYKEANRKYEEAIHQLIDEMHCHSIQELQNLYFKRLIKHLNFSNELRIVLMINTQIREDMDKNLNPVNRMKELITKCISIEKEITENRNNPNKSIKLNDPSLLPTNNSLTIKDSKTNAMCEKLREHFTPTLPSIPEETEEELREESLAYDQHPTDVLTQSFLPQRTPHEQLQIKDISNVTEVVYSSDDDSVFSLETSSSSEATV